MSLTEQYRRFGVLSLDLEPELGKRNMSVKELMSLKPGSVIKLQAAVGSPLAFRIGGAVVGSAEFVRLGAGVLGLRIVDLKNPDVPDQPGAPLQRT